MRKIVHNASHAATIVAWTIQLYAVIPFGPDVSDHVGRLSMLVAGTGTIGWLFRRLMAPAIDLYEAGKRVGRMDYERELRAEQEDGVPRLDARRMLRVVKH
jgi:hypothetical protein